MKARTLAPCDWKPVAFRARGIAREAAGTIVFAAFLKATQVVVGGVAPRRRATPPLEGCPRQRPSHGRESPTRGRLGC